MEAALVEGIEFQKTKWGYWQPSDKYSNDAFRILETVTKTLGFSSIADYLIFSGSHPEEIQNRIKNLLL